MGILRGRSALLQSSKNTPAKRTLTGSRVGGSTATHVAETIARIRLTVEKYLSKYIGKYVLLRTDEDVKKYFDAIIENGIAAIDTETTGLDTMVCDIVGLCLYTPGQKAAYIPIGHVGHVTGNLLPGQVSKEVIAEQLDRCENIKWIFHNAKFDIRIILHTCGKRLKAFWDTQIAAKLLNENESAALKDLHLKYCDSQDEIPLTISTLFEGLTFSLIPIECAYLYAAGDAIKTFELYEFQKKHLESDRLKGPKWVFDNLEMPLIDVLVTMEDTGVLIDKEFAKKLHTKYYQKLLDAEKACYECLNKYKDQIELYKRMTPNHKLSNPINLSSPTQIAILLYDILQLTPKGIKDAKRGTGEPIIAAMDHEFPKLLLDYRAITKLMTTYVDKLPAVVNPNTGRIHPSFNQMGAATGRTSSRDPNLQNIPSHVTDIRKMFVAPSDCYFVSGDFSLRNVG